MSITQTTSAQFTADNVVDIYLKLFSGDEWGPYQRVETGVDKPRVLPSGASSQNLLQANVVDPSASDASGDIAIGYSLLEVDRIMSLLKVVPEDWRADFPDFQPTGPSIDLAMNPNVLNPIMDMLKNGINTEIGALVYQGDSSLGSGQLMFTDGYSVKFKADANVVDVANVGVITVNNVLDIIQDIENAIPLRLRKQRKNDIKIFMSGTTYDLAMEANRATQQNATLLTTGNVTKSPAGYEMVPMESMLDNEIFATPCGTGKNSNLVRGVWFQGDSENFLMYREQPSHETWLIVLKFSLGVQYRTGEDVVFYVGS